MYYIVDSVGNRTPSQEGGSLGFLKAITADTTLVAEDSGKNLKLNAAAGKVITLPDLTANWSFRIFVGLAFATDSWTIIAPDSVIQGGAIVNSTFVPSSNKNTITFVNSAETLGDFVDIYCDGINIYASGVGASAGSITFSVTT
jgi:hypothetical protein